MKRTARGFSLLELAIGIACLGVMAILVLTFVQRQSLAAQATEQSRLLERADLALGGFVLSHNRLPCPDSDGDGRENCAVAGSIGALPFLTLGLADEQASQVRYGVYRQAGVGILDRNLSGSQDRFEPLVGQVVTGGILASRRLLGQATLVDFCAGLGVSARAALVADQLQGVSAAGANNLAYALSLAGRDRDGDGLPGDGNQVQASRFDAPTLAIGAGNDDRVRSVGFNQLYARLACSEVLTAAGTAHFNVGTAAQTLQFGATDYAQIKVLMVDLAKAAVASAEASVYAAAAGIASSAAHSTLSAADTLTTYGAQGYTIALAVADVVTNALATGAAIAGRVYANCAKAGADVIKQRAEAYRDTIRPYAQAIQANAVRGDRAQWWNTTAEVNTPAQLLAPLVVPQPGTLAVCSTPAIVVPPTP